MMPDYYTIEETEVNTAPEVSDDDDEGSDCYEEDDDE
jgi:hypothetical protein